MTSPSRVVTLDATFVRREAIAAVRQFFRPFLWPIKLAQAALSAIGGESDRAD